MGIYPFLVVRNSSAVIIGIADFLKSFLFRVKITLQLDLMAEKYCKASSKSLKSEFNSHFNDLTVELANLSNQFEFLNV